MVLAMPFAAGAALLALYEVPDRGFGNAIQLRQLSVRHSGFMVLEDRFRLFRGSVVRVQATRLWMFAPLSPSHRRLEGVLSKCAPIPGFHLCAPRH